MTSSNKTYYQILQVDPDAEPEIIEAAYKRLIRMYHPDVNHSADATRRMQEMNAAYDVLRDPAKRAQYDREQHTHTSNSSHSRSGRGSPAGSTTRSRASSTHQRSSTKSSSELYFTFMIVSASARKACTVYQAALKDGAPVLLQSPQGQAHQLWRFEPLDGADHGYCRIRALHSGKVLDVTNRATADGIPVVQWSYLHSPHQQWKLIDRGGAFVIQARHSGKVLDAVQFFQRVGGPVTQWSRHDGDNQRWLLVKP